MTVAVDIKTNRIIGQVLDRTPVATMRRDPKARRLYLLLTANGYMTVPAASVRLEKVS